MCKKIKKNKKKSNSTTKRAAKLTTCMISQSVLPQYWKDWDADEQQSLGDVTATANTVYKRLTDAGLTIIEMYAIIHDNDQRKMWDEYLTDYMYLPVREHIHIVIKFADGATLESIADIVGIAPEYIEIPRTGRFAYNGMKDYLCHAKYPKKYGYDPRKVVTIIGEPYLDYASKNRERWMRTRYERIIRNSKDILNEIRVRIGEGEISTKELVIDPDYKQAYYLNKSKIDSWLRDKADIDRLEKKYGKKGGVSS